MHQNPSWSDYPGNALRGDMPIKQLMPQHYYIVDTSGLAEVLEKYTQHLMLLTLEEAQRIVDNIGNGKLVSHATTLTGNIDSGTGKAGINGNGIVGAKFHIWFLLTCYTVNLINMAYNPGAMFIVICMFVIIILTCALVFFTTASYSTVDILSVGNTLYYDWRTVFTVLTSSVAGCFYVMVMLFLFIYFIFLSVRLWCEFTKIINGYTALDFVFAFLLSFWVPAFFRFNNHWCLLKGRFSGVNDVKDSEICKQYEYHPEYETADISSISVTAPDKK